MNSQVMALTVNSQSNILSDNYYDEITNASHEKSTEDNKTISIKKTSPNYFELLNSNRSFNVKTREKQIGWWVGYIENVYEEYFTAVLEDLQGKVSIAEFDKDEITPNEISLIAPKVRFTYSVTQVDKYSGREYISKISISGPPVWTENDSKKFQATYDEIFPEELFNF